MCMTLHSQTPWEWHWWVRLHGGNETLQPELKNFRLRDSEFSNFMLGYFGKMKNLWLRDSEFSNFMMEYLGKIEIFLTQRFRVFNFYDGIFGKIKKILTQRFRVFKLDDGISWQNWNPFKKNYRLVIKGPDGFESWKRGRKFHDTLPLRILGIFPFHS